MYSLIAFGHSHIVAVAKGAYEYASAPPEDAPAVSTRFNYLYDPAYTPVVQGSDDALQLNPKLAAQLSEADWTFVLLMCGGNEHNVLGIVRSKRPFDFVLGSEPDLPLQPGFEQVPEALIRETLKSYMSDVFRTIRAFRVATQRPILQLEPPPPLPNHRVLAYPGEFFRSRLSRQTIAPEAIRYKLWRLQSNICRRFCRELGVIYVGAPADMIAESGMLAEVGWGADATHANASYGRAAFTDALDVYRATLQAAEVTSS